MLQKSVEENKKFQNWSNFFAQQEFFLMIQAMIESAELQHSFTFESHRCLYEKHTFL